MNFDEIYFWTASIHQWKYILRSDVFKDIIIDSLVYLTYHGFVDVFGFVIMPNHLHFIWRMLKKNGKETPQGSFLKFTAHKFLDELILKNNNGDLPFFVEAANRKHQFWQRDPLAVKLYSKHIAFQKLDYIHRNPLADHWKLASDPIAYKYSSAKYYDAGEKNWGFLKDLRDEF